MGTGTETMMVLADDAVEGHRVVTYYSGYRDKIMARRPYRTEVVKPGEVLPSHGIDHASEDEALKAHQEMIAKLSKG